MNKISNKLSIGLGGLVAFATIAGIGTGIVSAAAPTVPLTNTHLTAKVKPAIAPYVMQADRIQAEAQALGMTQAQLISALKTASLKQVLTKDNLKEKTFRQKVHQQIITELTSQGYSSTQINQRLKAHHGHRHMHKNKNHANKHSKKSKS